MAKEKPLSQDIDEFDPTDYTDDAAGANGDAPVASEAATLAGAEPRRRGRPKGTTATTTTTASTTRLRIDLVLDQSGTKERRVLVVSDTPAVARAQARAFFEAAVVESL